MSGPTSSFRLLTTQVPDDAAPLAVVAAELRITPGALLVWLVRGRLPGWSGLPSILVSRADAAAVTTQQVPTCSSCWSRPAEGHGVCLVCLLDREDAQDTDEHLLPAHATPALPGTRSKLEVLKRRASRGELLFHPADARLTTDKIKPPTLQVGTAGPKWRRRPGNPRRLHLLSAG